MTNEAATGDNQTALQNLKAAESELTDALNKVQTAEKEMEPMSDPNVLPSVPVGTLETPADTAVPVVVDAGNESATPVTDPVPPVVIDSGTGLPQTPQPVDDQGNLIPTPDVVPPPLDSGAAVGDAVSPAAPTITPTDAVQAAPAPLTTPDPLTLEQFCRNNPGSLTAVVQINDAGDVMLVFTGGDGMPDKIFEIMGAVANNVTLLAA